MMPPTRFLPCVLFASFCFATAVSAQDIVKPGNNAPQGDPYRPEEEPTPFIGKAPARPITLMAAVDDAMLPVVRLAGLQPVVLRDGRPFTTTKPPAYAIVAARSYHPGGATFDLVQLRHWDQGREGSRIDSASHFEGFVTAASRLENAFILVVVIDERDFLLESKEPGYGAAAVELGTLEAGARAKFELSFPIVSRHTRLRWLATIFADGLEVPVTNAIGSFSSLLDRIERHRLARIVDERRGSKASHDALLFRPFPLVLPPELSGTWAGAQAKVEIDVDRRGGVSAVRLISPADRSLQDFLSTALEHWLFIPQIEGRRARNSTESLTLRL